ncbi:tellurite resistance protein TerC [Dysgonomonadaceae bacterium PH5-43]|nr:tellurite resistance protein TerC [Dysgonomonadaceae bacterium PH5-43]
MEITSIHWFSFIVFVVIMLLLDLGVFHKKDSVVSIKSAICWSIFWISLALLFNTGIYFFLDKTKALEFFTAYVLEKSLSVDNLFVFILIFGYFKIAPQFQHKILFWGILGALVMRALFIFAGVALISHFSWIMYIFGVFLIYSGIHILTNKQDNEDFDPNKNIVIRVLRKIMPVTDNNSENKFFIKKDHTLYATTFFIALIFIEASDLVFAVDSIPAVLSVSKDTFIVFTSNIFAILGLRSLYFALNGIMDYFYYLKYALAGILSFIGIKMCVNELCHTLDYNFHISNFVSLGIILSLLTISIVFSIIKKKKTVS